ncbi:hypothetical protein RRG08_035909 [Elysia crispata]|uniref:Uncharacterized protein n=1 Tax=Elysia crispata TaxID=231223 RepID=A0AAE1A3F0_9GAST|nr:hypothetical protein RRG08_035909 [Elysia crispata]
MSESRHLNPALWFFNSQSGFDTRADDSAVQHTLSPVSRDTLSVGEELSILLITCRGQRSQGHDLPRAAIFLLIMPSKTGSRRVPGSVKASTGIPRRSRRQKIIPAPEVPPGLGVARNGK